MRGIAMFAMLASGCGPVVGIDDSTSAVTAASTSPDTTRPAESGGPPHDGGVDEVGPSSTTAATMTGGMETGGADAGITSSEPESTDDSTTGASDPIVLDDCLAPPQFATTQVALPDGGIAVGVALFDADGIGGLDLLVTDLDGRVIVFAGAGDGTFQPATVLELDRQTQPFDVVIGDLDENGANDIIVADRLDARVWIWLADPAGGYLAPVAMDVTLQAWTMALHDLDGDGHLDLAVLIDHDHGYVLAAYGDGTGALLPGPEFAVQSGPREFAMADLDLDGRIDAIGANVGDGLLLRENVGDGYFDNAGTLDLGAEANHALAADLGGDAFPELVVPTGYEGDAHLRVWNGAPDFGYAEATVLLTPLLLRSVIAADAGGGPALDVAGIGSADVVSSLWLVLDWDTEALCQVLVPLPDGFAERPTAGDIDADGDDDFAIAQGAAVTILTRL